MYGMISRLSNKPDFKIFSVIFEKSIFNRGREVGGFPHLKCHITRLLLHFKHNLAINSIS